MRRRAKTRSWTDHNVHDPGVTMLQVLAYALSAVAVAGGVALVRRWRRSQDSQLPTS